MVASFKARSGNYPVYEINSTNVEEHLAREPPWLQTGSYRDDERHFAACPYCNNSIQLKGLYRRRPNSPRPYGSHTGKNIQGFSFDPLDLRFCPYKLTNLKPSRDARRPPGAASQELIRTAITEFDRIVLILRDDFGFPFSISFAKRMLEQWFISRGYLYYGAHLRNLPWMIAYFGPELSIFGQYISRNEMLVERIKRLVPQAELSREGQLVPGTGNYKISVRCLHHRFSSIKFDECIQESMTIKYLDFTHSHIPDQAPTILRSTINFDPERFEALINTPPERAIRNEALLEIARTVAQERGIGCTIIREI